MVIRGDDVGIVGVEVLATPHTAVKPRSHEVSKNLAPGYGEP
jgi:hypothetical protein